MAISDILNKIEQDTADRSKKIKAEADKKMKELQDKHDETTKKMKEDILASAKQRVQDLQREAEVAKNLSKSASELQAKRMVVEELTGDGQELSQPLRHN